MVDELITQYAADVATTMHDLIDRREAIETAIEAADEWDGGGNIERAAIIGKALYALPGTRPVVLCKDCVFKYFNEVENDYLCARFGTLVYQHVADQCYCAWAERKKEDARH